MTEWLLWLSNILSIITIVLCLILKVPQIIRLIKSGQAAGLSFKGLLLELSSYNDQFISLVIRIVLNFLFYHYQPWEYSPLFPWYTVTMMYNYTNRYALLSYLEYPIIIIQEYVLIGFVMHYKNYKFSSFLFLLGFYVLISLAFGYNVLSKFILTVLLPLTTPVSAISKIMQLIEIISKKNADSVSVLTWFLSLFTNVTRIYTVFMDSGDINLLLNFSVSSVLSGAVMGAALYYQRQSRQKIN